MLVQPDAESTVCIRPRWKTVQEKMYKMTESAPALFSYRYLIREANRLAPMAGTLSPRSVLLFAEPLRAEQV